ncbi:MAG: CsgG/HfaB family protein [Pseudomonadota bacterium]
MLARAFALLLAMLMVVPAAAQDKPIVGIAEMQDLAKTGQSDTFATMLETAIIGSGKFRIIERERLATLMKEQGLSNSGITTTNRPGQTGGFEGVDYLVYGTITSVSAIRKSNFGASLARSLFNNKNSNQPDCTNTDVTMEADIRITDTNTGEVLYAKRVSETQRQALVCGGGTQIDSSAMMRAAADEVATGLVTTLYPIQVAAIQGTGSVILNYGDGAVQQGDFLMIYGPATEIPDPSGNGAMLKIDGEKLGALQVTEVQTSFSRAVQVTTFRQALAVGAIARPATEDDVKFLQCQANPKKRGCKRKRR